MRAPDPPPPPPARPRLGRVLTVVVLSAVLLLAVGASVALILSERLGDNVSRVENAFAGLDESTRPPATSALTFLLVGTDSRDDASAPGVDAAGSRSDADVVMLARVAPDRRSAAVVTIPRDTVLPIPDSGEDRVNAAYVRGGPALLVRTVETVTNLRVDHFAVIDFAGFRSMVDAVDGIDVDVSPATGGAVPGVARGMNHLDGAAALAFVRHRDDAGAAAEVDRGRRQQAALQALLARVVSTGVLTDPAALYTFLGATTRAVGVDDTLDNAALRNLALQMRSLDPAGVRFVRAPVAAIRGDAVVLDDGRAQDLWAAIRAGAVGDYVRDNGRDALGPVAR